ncbi:hypothetical protein [Pelagicoccus albus]|uniref:Uncharacterized protein n=1 Tax=Pelagicoccus albus TaxID=415222 RepID=A0A7X1B363_9BACT|nr:hypothetical protein [Pelagicoccus albus]MBC2604737.1 hypothetical protein [Pelagicoccus albus]
MPSIHRSIVRIVGTLILWLPAGLAEAQEQDQETIPLIASQTEAVPEKTRRPFQRRLMRDDITVRIKNLRLDSGGKIRLVYGVPNGAKEVPAVVVMDVEANRLANSSNLNLHGATKSQNRDYRHIAYLFRSPFGSHMLGSGFAVAYVVADDLETLRSARTNDWIGIFNRVRDLKPVTPDNVFLFSTREYANLSLYLSSKYRFSGLILEEPSYLLFSSRSYESVLEKCKTLDSREIWNRTDPTREFVYEKVLERISSPIMLIRNPQSRAYHLNEKTLIPKLEQVRAFYETAEIMGPGRALTVFGGNPDSGILEISPEVAYHQNTVNEWVDTIIHYMRMNSSVDPVALRDPSELSRTKSLPGRN